MRSDRVFVEEEELERLLLLLVERVLLIVPVVRGLRDLVLDLVPAELLDETKVAGAGIDMTLRSVDDPAPSWDG